MKCICGHKYNAHSAMGICRSDDCDCVRFVNHEVSELSDIRTTLTATQNELHQMTHNAVGAEMERDELREALTAAQEEAQRTRELWERDREHLLELGAQNAKQREALKVTAAQLEAVKCKYEITAASVMFALAKARAALEAIEA